MLQYILTVEASGPGNASKFFKLIRDESMLNLTGEEISSLERAINNPSFVKDLKVEIPGPPGAWCFITKDGIFGPLRVKFYTHFGAMSPTIKNYVGTITKKLSAAGFGVISQYESNSLAKGSP
ncbi:MAG: hypothetical protein QXR60_04195 [Candidatus Nanoarchaeia archaeon]